MGETNAMREEPDHCYCGDRKDEVRASEGGTCFCWSFSGEAKRSSQNGKTPKTPTLQLLTRPKIAAAANKGARLERFQAAKVREWCKREL
jgi:hypothetical protein